MHYYQVFYMIIPKSEEDFSSSWTIYKSDKPYNPNILKDVIRKNHGGRDVVIQQPVNEITKDDYDDLYRRLTSRY